MCALFKAILSFSIRLFLVVLSVLSLGTLCKSLGQSAKVAGKAALRISRF